MTPPPLYTLSKELPKKTIEGLKKKLEVFDKSMEPIMLKIKEANTTAGVHYRRSQATGRCMFARNAIKRGTTLFVYFGDVVDAKAFAGTLTYTYGADITGNKKGEFFIDGKAREKGFMRHDWRFVNGIYINHSCKGHNLKTEFVKEPKSGIWYVAFSTSRAIKAGEQLLSNYNEGKSKNKYWRLLTTLEAKRVPEERIVKCKCFTNKNRKGCPNNFAYDKDEMRAYGLDTVAKAAIEA